MKSSIHRHLAILIFHLFSLSVNAQNQRDWALGLSLVPSINSGSSLGIDAVRRYNNKWQLGLKTYVWHYTKVTPPPSPNPGKQETGAFGATIGPRYSLFDLDNLKPYILVSLGFAYQVSYNTYTYSSYDSNWDHWYIVYSLRFGSEVILAQSNWSIDLNMGYLGLMGLESGDRGFYRFIISFGVLKRFAAK